MQKCFKVTNLVKGQCTFYNSTALSSKEQVHDAIITEHFKPLFTSSCSPYAQILVCSTFLPFCVSSHRQVQPCHPHFPEVKSSCIHHFHTSNIAWPSTLNCSKLPSPQVCISPPLSNFSLLFIFTFLRFFTSPSSTMLHHFLEVKSSCIHHFHTSNIAWPSTLNCSKLPSPPQVCISPPLSSTSPSPVSVPV